MIATSADTACRHKALSLVDQQEHFGLILLQARLAAALNTQKFRIGGSGPTFPVPPLPKPTQKVVTNYGAGVMLTQKTRRRRRKPEAPWPFLKVPRLLIDSWMTILSPAEFYVWLYIFRRTIGYKKDWEQLSYEEISTGQVARSGKIVDHGTGLGKNTVIRAINKLKKRGLLAVQEHPKRASSYSCILGIPDTTLNTQNGYSASSLSTTNGYSGIPKLGTQVAVNAPAINSLQTPIEDNREYTDTRKRTNVVALPRSVDRR